MADFTEIYKLLGLSGDDSATERNEDQDNLEDTTEKQEHNNSDTASEVSEPAFDAKKKAPDEQSKGQYDRELEERRKQTDSERKRNTNLGEEKSKQEKKTYSKILMVLIPIGILAIAWIAFTLSTNSRRSSVEPDRDQNALQENAAYDVEDKADEVVQEDTDGSSDQALASFDTINDQTSIGDYVYFGAYEQDNNFDNGKEPIEWIVLDEDDDRYLLLSSEVIDEVCYNNEWEPMTWKNCSMRAWLNVSFLEEAFTKEQIYRIAEEKHWDEDGDSTTDKVFILDQEELEDYFDSNSSRKAGATSYAEAQGVYEYINGNCWWWVREAGADPHYAKYVNCEGAILEYGMLIFNNAFGVRPAIWVEK